MLARRSAAFAVDAVLSLMLAGLVLTPFVYLGDDRLWLYTDPIPLLWSLIMICMALGSQGMTPGKRWAKLVVFDTGSGNGCLTCRELRRLGWAIAFGLSALVSGLGPDFLALGCALFALAHLGVLILWPALRGASDFPHNLATGLAVGSRQ